MLANTQHEYNDRQYGSDKLIEGWHKVAITEITKPKPTKAGNATGFFINLDVWYGSEILEKSVYLSFDHPSDFVMKKSKNIGAMLQQMFPSIHADEGYVGCTFWLHFKMYKDKTSGDMKESFFDFRDNVSLDGLTTLHGDPCGDDIETKARRQAQSRAAEPNGGDDPPF